MWSLMIDVYKGTVIFNFYIKKLIGSQFRVVHLEIFTSEYFAFGSKKDRIT